MGYVNKTYLSTQFKNFADKIAKVFSKIGHTHLKSDITDFPTSMPANGGNAATVGGHTVGVNVPSNAKFTDTTYGVATSSALGLVKSGTDITVDSSGNVSVNDDSHNHVISNVDGLQSALDGKASSSHTHNYAGSSRAGGSANSLSYFYNTSTTDVGINDTSANAVGYVSGTSSILGQNDGAMYKQVYSGSWAHEIYGDYRTGQLAVRGKNNGTWQSWRKILDESNYKSYCTPANIGAATSSHTHASVNGVTPEWSGSVSFADTGWLAAWNSDGTKIKALDKNYFATASHTHTKSQITDFPTSLPANGGNADTVDGHHFNWSGQSGQPTWVWGGNDSSNMYVYNPSNFSVNYANGAGTVKGSYTGNGGQQNPNYFGVNKVGFLMMNTTVNGDNHYKDWIIMDCYSGSDVGGATAIGVDRQEMRAFIMGSDAARTSWSRSAELITTANIGSQSVSNADTLDGNHASAFATASHTHDYVPLSGNSTVNGAITFGKSDNYGIRTNTNNYGRIGDSTNQFYEVHSYQIYENKTLLSNKYLGINANAVSATKATQDGNGNVISSTYLPLSGGTLNGQIHFNNNSLPVFDGSIPYLVGIESFADGGTLKWQSASSVSVGYATSAGNADTVDGFHASQSAGSKSTCVVTDSNGYTNLNYINSNTGNNENPSISQVIVTNGSDNYYRKASLSHLKSSLGSMPASDVYAWAKASTKPSYTASEVGAISTSENTTLNATIILGKNDEYGIYPNTNNYCQLGRSNLKFWKMYATNGYFDKINDGTPITSSNIGSQSVNYANTAGSAPASDVYAWAKASSKPSYSWSEITGKPFTTVDSALSGTSTNPVQNNIVKLAVDTAVPNFVQGGGYSGDIDTYKDGALVANRSYFVQMSNLTSSNSLPISSGYGILYSIGTGNAIIQMIYHYNTSTQTMDAIYSRVYINGGWHYWSKIAATKVS